MPSRRIAPAPAMAGQAPPRRPTHVLPPGGPETSTGERKGAQQAPGTIHSSVSMFQCPIESKDPAAPWASAPLQVGTRSAPPPRAACCPPASEWASCRSDRLCLLRPWAAESPHALGVTGPDCMPGAQGIVSALRLWLLCRAHSGRAAQMQLPPLPPPHHGLSSVAAGSRQEGAPCPQ